MKKDIDEWLVNQLRFSLKKKKEIKIVTLLLLLRTKLLHY